MLGLKKLTNGTTSHGPGALRDILITTPILEDRSMVTSVITLSSFRTMALSSPENRACVCVCAHVRMHVHRHACILTAINTGKSRGGVYKTPFRIIVLFLNISFVLGTALEI